MERLLTRLGSALLLILGAPAVASEWHFDASAEISIVDVGPLPSFQDGSQGKFRYGENDSPLQPTGGYLQIASDLDAAWHAKLTVTYNDQVDQKVDITEAYLQFRPLPVDGIRWRAKIGAFRPPISFEHSETGWATLYTTNASAINSWVGEELGGLGFEVIAKKDLASTNSLWSWTAAGAVLYGNDTSGVLMSWRGWSMNNWQTAWNGEIELAALPLFNFARSQEPVARPFLELDNEPGYYVWAEISKSASMRIRAMYYDNRADMDAQGYGQKGWTTTFSAISSQFALPADIGLIAQFMDGRTRWGRVRNGRRTVDNNFLSYFVMFTKSIHQHRLSVRRDWMRVGDNDFTPIDPNKETGTGWTASYQYKPNDHWTFGLEWMQISSKREARVFEGEDPSLTEDTLMLSIRWDL